MFENIVLNGPCWNAFIGVINSNLNLQMISKWAKSLTNEVTRQDIKCYMNEALPLSSFSSPPPPPRCISKSIKLTKCRGNKRRLTDRAANVVKVVKVTQILQSHRKDPDVVLCRQRTHSLFPINSLNFWAEFTPGEEILSLELLQSIQISKIHN